MRSISSFVCQECGYDSPKWFGKCPECDTWNSLKEFQANSKLKGQSSKSGKRRENEIKPRSLDEVEYEEKTRISTGFSEMDNVLGGGIVQGSVTLLAGDPGIGKSTLLLQTALNIANRLPHVPDDARQRLNARGPVAGFPPASARSSLNLPSQGSNELRAVGSLSTRAFEVAPRSVLYVSGEESEEQIKLRAKRILGPQKGIKNLLLLSIANTDSIVSVIEDIKPALVIIDSIQTMESESLEGLSGSVGQVRYAASVFIRAAKELKVPVILVGHVTKEGMVAGPMVLSHMVDTVLFLEGEKLTNTRLLRGLKNRFGPVDEVGVFTMEGEGISEVKNPEEIFLTPLTGKEEVPGSVLMAVMEGTRPFLVELQALVVYSKLPMPRRVASGIDSRRLELLLAVLQKHCRLPLESMDVFVNVAGGLKVLDRASDLAICLAIYSSLKNIPLPKTVGVAEVGLLGELRNVPSLEKRIKQAKKLGFRNIISTQTNGYLREVIKS